MTADEAGEGAKFARFEKPVSSVFHYSRESRSVFWEQLRPLKIDAARFGNWHPSSHAFNPAISNSFEALAIKVQHAAQQFAWHSILVTAPAQGCGKTTVCANLALALSGKNGCRVVLVDLDRRRSRLLRFFGGVETDDIPPLLAGRPAPLHCCRRVEPNLAVAWSIAPHEESATLPDGAKMEQAVEAIKAELAPDFVIVNGAPLLSDIAGPAQSVDCALIVAAVGQSSLPEIANCVEQLSKYTNIVGIALNKVH